MSVNFNAMKNILVALWRPSRVIRIKDIESNLLMVQFYHEIDLHKLIEGAPWTFDSHLLLVHRLKLGEVPYLIQLFNADIWVQVYGLPIGIMLTTINKQIENFIGSYMDYDANNDLGIWREYMRIRVRIDVRLPLKRW